MRPEEMELKSPSTLESSNGENETSSTQTKSNFIHVPSIHEVDEDDTDEECTYNQDPNDHEEIPQEAVENDTQDNESSYTGDSFCSDGSGDESETTIATAKSFASSSLVRGAAIKFPPDDSKRTQSRISEEELSSTIGGRTVLSSRFNKNYASEDKSSAQRQMKNRKNMSFTDDQVRRIERENQLLLKKIMAHQKPRDKILRANASQPRSSSSAINRRKLQKQIDYDNMLLLQRIQQTKSRVTNATKSNCKVKYL